MSPLEETRTGCDSAPLWELVPVGSPCTKFPRENRGVLVNQGGLPTQMMTRGRGVLLFYRGGFATHSCLRTGASLTHFGIVRKSLAPVKTG